MIIRFKNGRSIRLWQVESQNKDSLPLGFRKRIDHFLKKNKYSITSDTQNHVINNIKVSALYLFEKEIIIEKFETDPILIEQPLIEFPPHESNLLRDFGLKIPQFIDHSIRSMKFTLSIKGGIFANISKSKQIKRIYLKFDISPSAEFLSDVSVLYLKSDYFSFKSLHGSSFWEYTEGQNYENRNKILQELQNFNLYCDIRFNKKCNDVAEWLLAYNHVSDLKYRRYCQKCRKLKLFYHHQVSEGYLQIILPENLSPSDALKFFGISPKIRTNGMLNGGSGRCPLCFKGIPHCSSSPFEHTAVVFYEKCKKKEFFETIIRPLIRELLPNVIEEIKKGNPSENSKFIWDNLIKRVGKNRELFL